MTFLLAPNAMKGSLSAQHIAAILQKSLRRKYPQSTIISSPVADGGNGTLECLMNALGGTVFEKAVTGPISTTNVTAHFGITKNSIGIIESAEATGLHLVTPSPETIALSTSYGVGELIKEAMTKGCTEIWIGLGGSGTNDAGGGMAQALGVQLIDDSREELKEGAMNLLRLDGISNTEYRMLNIPVKILSDVKNVLLGEQGATYTFARQKGASKEQLPYLESALKNFADVTEEHVKKEFRNIPGSGAAGGLGFGLLAFCSAEIVSGIDFILDAIGFDDKLRQCDAVITTEGMLDEQTLLGKGIAGIAERARTLKKPVHAFVGMINGRKDELQRKLSLASITQISPDDLPTIQAMRDASWLLADAVFHHDFSGTHS
ncbi:MAG: glycerate kinase [Ignavibacteriales bacterium]|nr:glycerate kinase [Ignavibacteriales bacterium]